MASTVSLRSASAAASTLRPSGAPAEGSATPSGAAFRPYAGLRMGFSLASAPGQGQVIVVRRTGRPGSARRQTAVAAASVAAEEVTVPPLNDISLTLYINQNGRIQPPIEPTTKATVFAIFDKNKKAQYIGFSKDVRNSLRTLMGRRPELCFYYKLFNLNSLDQKTMLKCRQQWVSEMGLPPVGNGDPVQKNLWEQPADSGSISERGKLAAATSNAKRLSQAMLDRGVKEEMVYDPALLAQGKCDVLVSADQSAEEVASAARVLAASAARRHDVVVTAPSGEKVEYEIFVEQKFPTNGGWMYDVLVSKDDKETRHRVICGRMYPESVDMHEDRFVEIIIGFLLYKKTPRRTEGLMAGDEFPINYFAVSEVAQHFDDMKDWFEGQGDLPDTYWRFNRIHDYGAANEEPMDIGPNLFGQSISSPVV